MMAHQADKERVVKRTKYFFILLVSIFFFQISQAKEVSVKESLLKSFFTVKGIANSVHFSLSPDGKEIYAIDRKNSRLLFINSQTGKVFYSLSITLENQISNQTLISQDGSKLYIAEFEKIHVVDLMSRKEIALIKTNSGYSLSDMSITAAGDILFVADFFPSFASTYSPFIYIVNTHTNKVVGRVYHNCTENDLNTGSISMALNYNESFLYLVDWISLNPRTKEYKGSLSILDTKTQKMIKKPKTISPGAIYHVTSNKEKIYIPAPATEVNNENGELYVLNANDYKIIKKIPITGILPVMPVRVVFAETLAKIYVINFSGDIAVINDKSEKQIKTIKVGSNPYIAQISKNDSKLYVGSSDNTLSVVDTNKDEVMNVIHLPE